MSRFVLEGVRLSGCGSAVVANEMLGVPASSVHAEGSMNAHRRHFLRFTCRLAATCVESTDSMYMVLAQLLSRGGAHSVSNIKVRLQTYAIGRGATYARGRPVRIIRE